MSSLRIALLNQFGAVITPSIPYESATITLRERDIGAVSIEVSTDVDPAIFDVDSRIVLYHTIGGAAKIEGDCAWLVRHVQRGRDETGKRSLLVEAVHPNDLLRRRAVVYPNGSAEGTKTGAADTVIAEVIDENFINATEPARNWPTTLFDVLPVAGNAPTVSRSFSRLNVLKVCQTLCAQAEQQGTYTGFEVIDGIGAQPFRLRMYTVQRGVDRTGSGFAFSPQRGNISEYTINDDQMDAATVVYGAGAGAGLTRNIVEVKDDAAIALSPLGRIELGRDGRQNDPAGVQGEALAALNEKRPRTKIDASVQQVAGAIYGIHYGWGDLVDVSIEGYNVTARVDPVQLRFSPKSRQVQIRLQVEV